MIAEDKFIKHKETLYPPLPAGQDALKSIVELFPGIVTII